MTISDGDTYKSKNLQLNNGKDLEMPCVLFCFSKQYFCLVLLALLAQLSSLASLTLQKHNYFQRFPGWPRVGCELHHSGVLGFFESAEVSAIVVFTGILPNSSAPRGHPSPYNVAACLPKGVFLMTDGSLFSHAGGNFINSVSADRTRHPASFKVNPAKNPPDLAVKLRISLGLVHHSTSKLYRSIHSQNSRFRNGLWTPINGRSLG